MHKTSASFSIRLFYNGKAKEAKILESKISSARAHLIFDCLVVTVEKNLVGIDFFCPGIDPAVLKKRIVQRLIALTEASHKNKCRQFFKSNSASNETWKSSLLSGFTIDHESGKVKTQKKTYLKFIFQFLANWTHVLLCHLIALRFKSAKHLGNPATLVSGVGDGDLTAGGDDTRFLNFCKNGPITPLNDAKKIVIQTKKKMNSIEPKRVFYERFPLHSLAQKGIGFIDFLRFFYHHLKFGFIYIVGSIRNPLMSILSRDFAFQAMANELDRRGMISATVDTNSNFDEQMLWMRTKKSDRKFTTHMVWYSTNNIPVLYKNDPIVAFHPSFRHISVDETWTWADWHAKQLNGLGIQGQKHVVGPILFYLPGNFVFKRVQENSIRIALFDITPVTLKYSERMGFLNNYYNSKNMIQFIESSIAVGRKLQEKYNRQVEFLLKHKRGFSAVHDTEYSSFIVDLERRNSNFKVVPPDTDMYSIVSSSDLVVVVPRSSPAHVARHLGKNAIFFDPTRNVVSDDIDHSEIIFASGSDELLGICVQLLGGAK